MATIMSREVLRKAWVALNTHAYIKVIPLMKEIETELAKPEPEPVAWVAGGIGGGTAIGWKEKDIINLPLGTKLYVDYPDQSARIAELERVNTNFIKANNALRKECETLEKELQQHRECNDKLEFRLLRANENMESLEQQLATLQAKLEPLNDKEIDAILDSKDAESGGSHAFAKAIEAAHGII